MKNKLIALCAVVLLGIALASCGAAGKTCPAYANADTEVQVEVNN